MPRTLNLDADFFVLDDTENVRLEAARRPAPFFDSGQAGAAPPPPAALTAPNAACVVPAMRRALTAAGVGAAGSAYVKATMEWFVPRVALPDGWRPKPADVLEVLEGDDAGDRYTALTAARQVDGSLWKLSAVNLVLALDLRDTISIERASISYDAAGAPVKTFPPDGGGQVLYPVLRARVQEVTEEVVDQRGIRGPELRFEVVVDRQVYLSTEDRINFGGVYLDITGLRNPQRVDELPVIEAAKRP